MRWVVSATEAVALIEAGALVLDVRPARLRWWDPAPGAVPTSPALLAEPELPNAGRLLADDAELGRRLQALGVRNDTAVVVLGDPNHGWAEDGRLVWSLRALGHERTVLVDGGFPAMHAAGLPVIRPPVQPGDFTVTRRADHVIGAAEVRALLDGPAVILDVREPAEYAGTEGHGERRLGHVPGARSLPWRDLLAADGTLLPEPLLRARLAAVGVPPDSEVVAYCTGRRPFRLGDHRAQRPRDSCPQLCRVDVGVGRRRSGRASAGPGALTSAEAGSQPNTLRPPYECER